MDEPKLKDLCNFYQEGDSFYIGRVKSIKLELDIAGDKSYSHLNLFGEFIMEKYSLIEGTLGAKDFSISIPEKGSSTDLDIREDSYKDILIKKALSQGIGLSPRTIERVFEPMGKILNEKRIEIAKASFPDIDFKQFKSD